MSQTFSLICRETKQRVWIGQGWGEMTGFYYGMPEIMDRLRRFLNAHRGKALEFVMNDKTDEIYDDGWQEFEAPPDDDAD